MTGNVWRQCSVCKRDIAFGAVYYQCSVSTCNKKRTGLRFCSVDCWDAHLPTAQHRSASAVEEHAPSAEMWAREQAGLSTPKTGTPKPRAKRAEPDRQPVRGANTPQRSVRRKDDPPAFDNVVSSPAPSYRSTMSHTPPSSPTMSSASPGTDEDAPLTWNHHVPDDVLVVVSKLKSYIRARSEMNTSDSVVGILSDLLRASCDQAIRNAHADDRKTVMDRDFRPGGE